QAGMVQRVNMADTQPDLLAGLQGVAAGLLLRARRLDDQRIAAVGEGRSNGTHAGDGGQANAQPLIGAAKEYLLYLPLPQGGAVEQRGGWRYLDIFGAEQRLDAAIGARWQDVAVHGKTQGPDLDAARRGLAHEEVRRAQEGGDKLSPGLAVQGLRGADF